MTPYVHILKHHTVQILKNHGSISKFSQQGFEACHRWHRILYGNSTNHDGCRLAFRVSSMEQILIKVYRMECLDLYFHDERGAQLVRSLLSVE